MVHISLELFDARYIPAPTVDRERKIAGVSLTMEFGREAGSREDDGRRREIIMWLGFHC